MLLVSFALLASAVSATPSALLTASERPALIQFWASWCTSCTSITKDVAALLEANAKTLPYLMVSLDEDPKAADAAAAALKKAEPHTARRFLRDADGSWSAAFQNASVPTVAIVDASGKITALVDGHFGPAQRDELAARLRELAVSKSSPSQAVIVPSLE